jgi:arylsulfatase A-like enzyme/Flp pilus assembly protein TadD
MARKRKKKKKNLNSKISSPGPVQESVSKPPARRRIWITLPTIAVAAGLLWIWVEHTPGTLDLRPSPNVLLISIDTLRADHVGAYGAEAKTATIDALAEGGVVFERSISSAPITLPSHASLFTGTYPIFHGVRDNGSFRLDDEHVTLAETFEGAGYRTAAFIGSFALDSRFGLDQGFEHYDDFYGDTGGYRLVRLQEGAAEPGGREFYDYTISERPADDVLGPALDWLIGLGDEPWFAFIHIWDPHHPYLPPSPFRESHPDDLYTGEIAYVDEALGRFLRELEEAEELSNTLVVLTADHGEGLGEHGEKTHGMFAYESTLHVPLILQWQDVIPARRRVPARVRLIDLAPTILELAGLPPQETHQGESLVSLILDPSGEEGREIYFEALANNLNRNWAPLTGVYNGSFKFVDLPIPELYDLETDPKENRNLYEEQEDKGRELRSSLQQVVAAFSTEESRKAETENLDSETVSRLQALGYVVDPAEKPVVKAYTEEDDPKRLVHLSDKLDDGLAAHRAGRSEDAIRLFREIIEERPNFANAHANLAHVLHETGRSREAIAVIENALRNSVRTRTMMGRLGLYLQEVGELEKSADVLETVIEDDPSYVEAYNYLSVTYARLDRPRDAIRMVRKLLDLDPTYASGYSNLGSIFLSFDRLADAEKNFRRALDLDPRLARAWNGLGVVYAKTGRSEEAISAWTRTTEIDSGQFDTLYNLGTLLIQLNRFEEALPHLEQFVRTAPRDRYGSDIPKVQRLIARLKGEG